MTVTYKIHPSIGVARVGDSDEFYLAPETPGGLPILPDGRLFEPRDFRDAERRLRRQAARFRVFRYDDAHPGGVEVEAGQGGVARVEWTVHLANKKAIWYQFFVNSGEQGYGPDHLPRNPDVTDPERRRAMIIDPGPRTLTGPGQSARFSRHDNPHGYPMTFPPAGLEPFSIDTLGGMATDARGRLSVLGGHGRSGSSRKPPVIVDYANNDRWWDDTADGPVTAVLVLDDGSRVEVEGSAWVLVAPPKYAPQIENLVTLWDTVYDTSVRHLGLRPDVYRDSLWNRDYEVSFEREVLPILRRACRYHWVVAIPPHPHELALDKLGDPNPDYARLRAYYLQVVRPPSAPNQLTSPETGYPQMPFLAGDNAFEPGPLASKYLTVTDTQYFLLAQWAAGKFRVRGDAPEPAAAALDRAALENCVGGAFSPGIEMTWISRNPLVYEAPFRLHRKRRVEPPLSLGESLAEGLEPGDAAKYMALPWQADFNECSSQPVGDRWLWWWPAQRPLFVYLDEPPPRRQVPWVGTDEDQNAADYLMFADDIEMVSGWKELGFVWNAGTDEKPRFVEVERVLPRKPRCPER
jgi:hypothetical protein